MKSKFVFRVRKKEKRETQIFEPFEDKTSARRVVEIGHVSSFVRVVLNGTKKLEIRRRRIEELLKMTSSIKILLFVVIVAVGVGAIPPSIKRQGLYGHHHFFKVKKHLTF